MKRVIKESEEKWGDGEEAMTKEEEAKAEAERKAECISLFSTMAADDMAALLYRSQRGGKK